MASFSGCSSTPTSPPENKKLKAVIEQKNRPDYEKSISLQSGGAAYSILLHSQALLPLIKNTYTPRDIQNLRKTLEKSLDFSLDSRALPKAAERVSDSETDSTHYDAVWVRDSLWVYLALRESHDPRAKTLLLTLSQYFSSPNQLKRFHSVIHNPETVLGNHLRMNAIHIRFDRNSPTFQDVQENGKPQEWNHKQNDALGLFLDLYCRALVSGEITLGKLSQEQVSLLALFPKYFQAIRFQESEDAGSWEEIERRNTSSIGLVTSGLEKLQKLLKLKPSLGKKLSLSRKTIRALIDSGYKTVFEQLEEGGESPHYPKTDPRYREADAALLNLLYPAELSRLKEKDLEHVLQLVDPLRGTVGIRRYAGDSYQAGNFWFKVESNTEDTSSAENFRERGTRFIPGSEAQWFFDSWYGIAVAKLYKKFGNPKFKAAREVSLNRALGQVTGEGVLGADENPVPALALPESYNTVLSLEGKTRVFAPSPITPLNWAKATMRILLGEVK